MSGLWFNTETHWTQQTDELWFIHWEPGLSVRPMIQHRNTLNSADRRALIHSLRASSVSHWSDLRSSLGDSMSTFTRLLVSDGRWYRPWTGTTASCFSERKTSAVNPEDRYSGASRSTFESRRTYKTIQWLVHAILKNGHLICCISTWTDMKWT